MASTRPVRLRGDKHITKITQGALEGMVEQFKKYFIPLNYEHLTFIPPIGRFTNAAIVEAEDGHSELHATASAMPCLTSTDAPDLVSLYSDLSLQASPALSVEFEYSARNFERSIAHSIHQDIGNIASPKEAWAELPPLEFALVIPVIWGAAKFAGSFFEELGRAAGDGLATKIKSWADKSKQPDRTIAFSLQFTLPDHSIVYGFVLASSDDIESAVNSMLKSSDELASIASLQNERDIFPSMKRAAFFFDAGEWRLGWWTNGQEVFVEKWFQENPPDITGVLGK